MLIEEKIISGAHLVMDSCPIIAKAREHNLESSFPPNRFDKSREPKGDTDARLGLNAVRNYCPIAHITALLVALTAKHSGYPDKIRFVQSFVPIIFIRFLKVNFVKPYYL